jgi:hypothetical protein
VGLASYIRDKVGRGALPPGIPPKVKTLFGDGTVCNACEKPIRSAQIRYEFDLPDFGLYRFHFGCYGLFKADLIKRNWIDDTDP